MIAAVICCVSWTLWLQSLNRSYWREAIEATAPILTGSPPAPALAPLSFFLLLFLLLPADAGVALEEESPLSYGWRVSVAN